jgi:predicted GNAT superfamily acetyltransferase
VSSAWDLARDAAARADVEIRPVTTLEEADAVLEVLRETWGPAPSIPRELVRALQASGMAPIGAFAGDRLVGYVLGFLGADGDGIHVHSHMLAVLPEFRSKGVGHALKLAQRAAALDFGVRTVRWTFDPLIARNAYFNLEKLGAVADRFHRHFYGDMGDELNRDDRSDRLEVRWDLEPGRSPDHLEASRDAVVILSRQGELDLPKPVDAGEPADVTAVEIPPDYPALRERDRLLAAEWRDASARALEACFGAGLVGVAFLKPGAYLFARPRS